MLPVPESEYRRSPCSEHGVALCVFESVDILACVCIDQSEPMKTAAGLRRVPESSNHFLSSVRQSFRRDLQRRVYQQIAPWYYMECCHGNENGGKAQHCPAAAQPLSLPRSRHHFR